MRTDLSELLHQLNSIRERCVKLESRFAGDLEAVHPNYQASARNLIHYVALRQLDLRDVQDQLAALGLSSLGTVEEHVIPSIRAVERALECLGGGDCDSYGAPAEKAPVGEHARDLLGPHRKNREVRVMVTLPSEAATDYDQVRNLVAAGMDIARINCAHDGREDWLHMIRHVRRANDDGVGACRIVMDLAGQKHRTGRLQPGPRVLRLRPRRDAKGRVTTPKRVRFVVEGSRRAQRKARVVPVPRECIEMAEPGDRFLLIDTRGRKRKLRVVGKDSKGLIVESRKTTYIATGTKFWLIAASGDEREFEVRMLPQVEQPLVLYVDDELILTRNEEFGEPARIDDKGVVVSPAHIPCSPKGVFTQVSVGDPVVLNDGKIEGRIEAATTDRLLVRITRAKATGSKLRGDRAINFPETRLTSAGLRPTDRDNLDFIIEHADAVGLSFVRRPADVLALQEELGTRTERQIGVILKIETEQAFADLPQIMLAAMRSYPAGIMIARGDLAVEVGWARLAEIQEEILWLCAAAQIPVIWATQVLESEAKTGSPTRAEITDAAMSQRADCVMLNKGPHILSAIAMLDDILVRMAQHQHKKSARLRKLSISDI